MSKLINSKKAFLISFTSIILFCLLIVVALFAYKQIKLIKANKNYQQCLDDQIQADKVALSYIPTFNQVTVTKNHLFIIGVINNPNIEKLSLTSESGDDSNLIKTFNYNKDNGSFTYEVTTFQDYFNPTFNITLTPKDNSIVCTSSNAGNSNYDVKRYCNLSNLTLKTRPSNGDWCISGSVDLGLGSAPLWEFSDSEIKITGFSKDHLCSTNSSGYRAGKCTKIPPTKLLSI